MPAIDIPDYKNHPSILALVAHQKRLGLTNVRLAKRYLRCSDATWGGLRNGTYLGESISPWIEKIDAALRVIEDEQVDNAEADDLLDLSDGRAAIKAVRKCANEKRNRLVVYLADTGGGKTDLGKRIQAALGDTVVMTEATEVWRDNYLAACRTVGEALGIASEDMGSKREAENAIVDSLAVSPRIIFIDESHYCGKEALNLVKLILNRSMSRVLMASMPQLWSRMQAKNWEESRQLRNRTYAKIVVQEIGVADTKLFLSAKMEGFTLLKGEDADQAVEKCRSNANRFGLLNTLQLACNEARIETAGKPATLTVSVVAAALKRVEALRS